MRRIVGQRTKTKEEILDTERKDRKTTVEKWVRERKPLSLRNTSIALEKIENENRSWNPETGRAKRNPLA